MGNSNLQSGYIPENKTEPNRGSHMSIQNRGKIILKVSIVGILINLALAASKAIIGFIANSIAIVLDAVNNLSDALSSIITIIGMHFASKAPDRKHPLGHGRIEYITAMVIGIIILYAGITSLIESLKKIIEPMTPNYSALTIALVAVAAAVKLPLGYYVMKSGKKISSDSLIASGADAIMDFIISISILIAAIIYIFSSYNLEAYLGVIISFLIIKAGIDILRGTVSKILGERIDSELSKEIKKTICESGGVHGAYDLILHSYGPNMLMGSVNIEVPDTYTADMVDELSRKIQYEVLKQHSVVLAAVGIYSMNTKNDRAAEIRTRVTEIVMSHEYAVQMHGFYVDEKLKRITCDIIIDFAAPDINAEYEHIIADIESEYPEYDTHITLDFDISD